MQSRTLAVDARRIVRWADGFAMRHGTTTRAVVVDVIPGVAGVPGVLLTAQDGATALLGLPVEGPLVLPPAGADGSTDPVARLAAQALRPRRVAALLVRRGGYACAVVTPDAVLASKVGTRYVQGRTAAGGWSQQRFARRRENQTEDLVRSCHEVAQRIFDPAQPADELATGGDRALVDRVLELRPEPGVRGLPRYPHWAVGDPRSEQVKALPERVRQVVVELTEP